MPYSMTGMGRSTCRAEGLSILVELRSVNNRYLVIKNRIPDSLLQYEQRLHGLIRKQILRGTVDLFIKLKRETRLTSFRLNQEVLERYMGEVKRISKHEKLDDALVPELLLALPGVAEIIEEHDVPPKLFALVEGTVKEALDRLLKMRAAEGKRLARFVMTRHKLIEKYLQGIKRLAKGNTQERQARLKARIEELLKGDTKISPDDPSLQREIAFLADRSDITEEMDRLKSHLIQFKRIVDGNGEMGRQLDFLLQEIGREVNTIGSKASGAAISHDVVKMKAELEKIREQIQNIE